VSRICRYAIMLLVTRGILVNPCFPLYAMMRNVDSCSLRIATTAWWILESSFCSKGTVLKNRDCRNILQPRKRLLLHAKCSVTRQQKNGVARQKIELAAWCGYLLQTITLVRLIHAINSDLGSVIKVITSIIIVLLLF
jgi:hypothetical protein